MKKLIILITVLLLCSCEPKNYNCRLDYTINYPDDTIVKTFEWVGDHNSYYYLNNYRAAKVLYISSKEPFWNTDKIEIDAASTAEGGDIEIIKFRIFRKDEN